MGVKNQMGSGDIGVEGLLWCQERGWFLQESLLILFKSCLLSNVTVETIKRAAATEKLIMVSLLCF